MTVDSMVRGGSLDIDFCAGLKRGGLTILSGLRGSGKSQVAMSLAEKNVGTSLFIPFGPCGEISNKVAQATLSDDCAISYQVEPDRLPPPRGAGTVELACESKGPFVKTQAGNVYKCDLSLVIVNRLHWLSAERGGSISHWIEQLALMAHRNRIAVLATLQVLSDEHYSGVDANERLAVDRFAYSVFACRDGINHQRLKRTEPGVFIPFVPE